MIYFGTLLIAGFANICVTRIPISLIKSWWLDRVRGGVPHVVHKACPASNTKSHTRHTCNNLELPGLQPVAFFSWYAVAGIFSCKVFPSKCALISFIIFSAAFHVTSWLMTSNTRSFASDAMSTPSSASFSSTASSCVVPPVCTSGGTMCIFLSTRLPRGTPCCSLCLYRVLALNLITLGSELMHLLQPQGATSLPNPMFCGHKYPSYNVVLQPQVRNPTEGVYLVNHLGGEYFKTQVAWQPPMSTKKKHDGTPLFSSRRDVLHFALCLWNNSTLFARRHYFT